MIRSVKVLLVGVLAFAAFLPLTSASAAELVSFTSEDVLSFEAAAPAPSTCNLTLVISFTGYRDPNGIVNGTWSHHASTLCKLQFGWHMDYLWVRDWLYKGGVLQSASAPDSCGACLSVVSSGGMYCDVCNGSWVGKSEHIMRFPFIIQGFVGTKPSTCTVKTLRTINCKLQTAPLIL